MSGFFFIRGLSWRYHLNFSHGDGLTGIRGILFWLWSGRHTKLCHSHEKLVGCQMDMTGLAVDLTQSILGQPSFEFFQLFKFVSEVEIKLPLKVSSK